MKLKILLLKSILILSFAFLSTNINAQYYTDTLKLGDGQTAVTSRDSVLRYLDKSYTNNFIFDRIGLGKHKRLQNKLLFILLAKSINKHPKNFS